MGNVVRASHLYLHQPVAIKILLPEMTASESTKQRFLREAQATVRLKSEHSARVLDVGTTPEGAPFMVMEFLHGNDLNQILRHHGPQHPSIVVDLMLQACEGIAEAHALGIVHRDIKPSNFFITQRPDGSMLLKILDFGISKTPIGYDELTGTQTVIGTPSYMAPEQMKSGRSADPRSDVWSIGVVMYQMITGRTPFSGESYAELVLKVGLEQPTPIAVPMPSGLNEIILRCLEKEPNLRYQNVAELARMLAPYATDPAVAAASSGRTMRILQQRGALAAPSSPLVGGSLATPIPLSPAQLTPRSWPPSQGSSLSQGAGQAHTHTHTVRTRTSRGLLIAGVASLCVLAGVGGYAISQMSRTDDGRAHAQPPPQTSPVPAAPAGETPPPAAARAPSEPAAADTRPDLPDPKPTFPRPDAKFDDKSAVAAPDARPTVAKPADRPDDKAVAAKPDDRSTAAAATAASPDARPTVARPTVARPAERKPAVKPVEHKPVKPDERKPAAKPTPKPKGNDDLFDTRK
jgi:serine/threonine-protein kinase